jgi:hypothetical protein
MSLFHYTPSAGYKSIASAPIWLFRAGRPQGDHPFGAYFTDYDESTPNLALKLRVPRAKLAYFFEFVDLGDMRRIPGARGRHIFFSASDYEVEPERQLAHGQRPGEVHR